MITGIDQALSGDTVEDGTKHVVVYGADGNGFTAASSLRTVVVENRGELPAK